MGGDKDEGRPAAIRDWGRGRRSHLGGSGINSWERQNPKRASECETGERVRMAAAGSSRAVDRLVFA